MKDGIPQNSNLAQRLLGILGYFGFLFCLWLMAPAQSSAVDPSSTISPGYRADRILVMPKAEIPSVDLARFHSGRQRKVLHTFERIGRLQVLALQQGETVAGVIAQYKASGLVKFAEPDYLGQTAATPNDPKYGSQWALPKINAPAGWDVLTSASNVLVAVLDTGVRYTHEDLAGNMWVNPNGGGHGFNALTGSNDPSDDSTDCHGTMVAGVLGAAGNNGKGVAGVAWRVQIMACKCFNAQGTGAMSDVITCVDYALTNGAKIINASFGFNPDSLAFSNAFWTARNAGIIVVAACGNSATNIDLRPAYPASYHFDNIVSVASTSAADTLSSFSNYSPNSVHLGAPGETIWSTFGATDSFYYYNTGTSYAAPFVTGALALMLAQYPAETYQQVISRVLGSTDPLPSLAGKCTSGGRLNLGKALTSICLRPLAGAGTGPFQFRTATTPNRTCIVQTSSDLINWLPIATNITSANGTFDFADAQSVGLSPRFYRAAGAP